MKIKRFKNLWAMGLLLFGALLIAFYLLKVFFPKFIVGVAELPAIVNFGNKIDGNQWYYFIFYGITSFLSLYFYSCACCKTTKLDAIESLILYGIIIISHLVELFLIPQSFMFNNILYLLIPLIIAAKRKIKDFNIFYSTAICFIVTSVAQSLSLDIRGIITLISYPNTATYFVLLIDGYIWTTLLYLFFNYKGEQNNG